MKEGMFPLPAAARPTDAAELVQETVLKPVPEKLTAVVGKLLQSTWFCTDESDGVGFTVRVKFCGGPGQVMPLLVNEGVTVNVAVTGAAPLLTAVNAGMSPFPVGAVPTEDVLFVQANAAVPPVFEDEKANPFTLFPLHTSGEVTVFTCAAGFTVTVNDPGVPEQVTPLSV
jgi:hypothetical protein